MRRWRAENKVDGILSEDGAEERERANLQHMTYYKGLRDKRGRPLVVWKTGAIKARALMEGVTNEGVLRNHIYCKEGIMAQARAEMAAAATGDGEAEQKIEEMVVICDLEGLGLHVADWEAMECLRQGIEMEQRNYPETFAHIWLVRPPWIFSAVYSMVLPWLDDYAKARVTVIYDDHTTELLKEIDADQLPAFLGGEYQTAEEEEAAVDAEQSQEIAAGALWSTGVVVPDEGANVSWVWRTVSGQDLSFEVQFLPSAEGGAAEVVVPSERSDEDGNPIIGHYEASGKSAQAIWMVHRQSAVACEV